MATLRKNDISRDVARKLKRHSFPGRSGVKCCVSRAFKRLLRRAIGSFLRASAHLSLET